MKLSVTTYPNNVITLGQTRRSLKYSNMNMKQKPAPTKSRPKHIISWKVSLHGNMGPHFNPLHIIQNASSWNTKKPIKQTASVNAKSLDHRRKRAIPGLNKWWPVQTAKRAQNISVHGLGLSVHHGSGAGSFKV